MTKIDPSVAPKVVEMASSSSDSYGGSRSNERNHVNSHHPHYGSIEDSGDYHTEPQRSCLSRCCGLSVTHDTPISAIRRTFLLVVLFDLIACTVLWLIYTEVEVALSDPKPSSNPFYDQVVLYTFKTSLFDTVLLSLIRFVTLQLFYALLRASKPWFVALTTLGSTAFIIGKVVELMYDKTEPALEILDYIVLITSLVIPWVETWLLDLKVLPREKRDYQRLHDNLYQSESPRINHIPPSPTFHSPEGSIASFSESDDNRSFHSAFAPLSRSQSLTTLNDVASSPKARVQAAESYALNTLNADGWTLQSGTNEEKGVVYSKSDPIYGKIFKMVAVFDIPTLTFYNDQVENVEDMPRWNPTVSEQRILDTIDDHIDILYNVGSEQVGGMVSSRDFVFVRQHRQVDGFYLISSVGIELDSMPKQSKHVRGEQGPGVLKLTDVEGNKTKLEWVLNTNLKGWLPQYVIDQALSSVLMTYMEYMRKHCVELKKQTVT